MHIICIGAVSKFRDVTIAYGNKNVLDKCSFVVKQGESIALIGPSGKLKPPVLSTNNPNTLLLARSLPPDTHDLLLVNAEIPTNCLSSLRGRVPAELRDRKVDYAPFNMWT